MIPKKVAWVILAVVVLGGVLAYSLRTKPSAKKSAEQTDPNAPHLGWKFSSERAIFANLTLGPDGTIYASSNQGIYAISPEGNLKWHATYGSVAYTAMGSDGVLYAAEMHGIIFGVSPDGTVSWKPGYGLIGFHAPPAIGRGGMILYANTTSDLYAFEQGSTTAAWSQSTFREGMIGNNSPLPGSAGVGANSDVSPVVYSDDSITLPRQHWLHLLNADGSVAWTLEVTPHSLGPAALGQDGSAYTGDGNSLYAVDHSGSLSWTFEADEGCCFGSPVVDSDGIVYFTAGRYVYAVDRYGKLKWQVQPKHVMRTSPTLAADGSIYIASDDGLSALNPDGSEKWNLSTPGAGSSPALGADGTAYYVCGMIWVCAVQGIHSPLMKSTWPRINHDSGNTGNVETQF